MRGIAGVGLRVSLFPMLDDGPGRLVQPFKGELEPKQGPPHCQG